MRMEIILIIAGMGAVTFLTRFAGFMLAKSANTFCEKWLKHIPTAMLTALIVPAVLMPRGSLYLSLYNPYLLSLVIALCVALKTKSVLATVGVGMTAMLALKGLGL